MPSENFATVFVWYIWWPLLILFLIPFASRIWCAMCPIPAAGEWLQRKSFIEKSEGSFGLNRRWPGKLRTPLIGLLIFLFISIFHMVFISNPLATATLMLGLSIAALAFYLVFEKRAYCRYVCPIGSFLGLYSMTSSLELRATDRDVCVELRHSASPPCVRGTKAGYGCPWFENPIEMKRNNYCGLCMECVKTCGPSNISLNLRFFGRDLLVKTGRNFTEAFASLLFLSLGIFAYAMQYGPLVWMKPWAFMRSGTEDFVLYSVTHTGVVLLPALVIFPSFLILSKLISRGGGVSLKNVYTHYGYSLVPLGFAVWISFSLPLLFVGIPRAVSVISDPYGWGWDLLGTKDLLLYIPYHSFIRYLRVAVAITASAFSLLTGYKISKQLFKNKRLMLIGFAPVASFISAVTALMVWLFMFASIG